MKHDKIKLIIKVLSIILIDGAVFLFGKHLGYQNGYHSRKINEYDRGLSKGFMLGYTKACLDEEEIE